MNQIYVLDCSAVAASLLTESESKSIDEIFDRAVSGRVTLVVPALFWFEILNVLVLAERRRRIKQGEAARLQSLMLALPIQTDDAPSRTVLHRITRIATDHGLSAYDAAYVELAERMGARLKTLDSEILRLARIYPWIS